MNSEITNSAINSVINLLTHFFLTKNKKCYFKVSISYLTACAWPVLVLGFLSEVPGPFGLENKIMKIHRVRIHFIIILNCCLCSFLCALILLLNTCFCWAEDCV